MRGMIVGVLIGASMFTIGCGKDPTPPPAEPTPVAQVDTQNYYANGEFKVGSDLAAGEYIAVGTGYVELTRSTDDGKRQIIVNANLEGTRCYFDVQDGEYIKVKQDVKLYPSANAPALESGDTLLSGHYKIGKDAKAGEYKITLEQGGYFEVTTNTRHAGNYIVNNQFTNEGGSFYATALDGQYLLIRKGTGQFVGAPKPKATPPSPAPPPKVETPEKSFYAESYDALRQATGLRVTEHYMLDYGERLTRDGTVDTHGFVEFNDDGVKRQFWLVFDNSTRKCLRVKIDSQLIYTAVGW